MPLPDFAEIARSLREDDSLCITINVPQELTTTQVFLVGTTMTIMISKWVWQDVVTGITYLDTVMASMSLVSLGSTPMVIDHLVPALENLIDLDKMWSTLVVCPSP